MRFDLKERLKQVKYSLKNKFSNLKYKIKEFYDRFVSLLPKYEINQLKNETKNEFKKYENKVKHSLLITSISKKKLTLKIIKFIILSFLSCLTYPCFKLGMRNKHYDLVNGVVKSKIEKLIQFIVFTIIGNIYYIAYIIGYKIGGSGGN